MSRFYSSRIFNTQKKAIIDDPDELHHLAHVLRLKTGDEVELVNGRGAWAHGVLRMLTKISAEVELDHIEATARPEGPRIVLACALPKKAKFEFILEKATELGADEVMPLMTRRTEVVISGKALEHKNGRFLNVVRQAGKQSKRLWFPELFPITEFTQAVKAYSGPSNTLFIPWLGGERCPVHKAFNELRSKLFQRLVIFIGPEGDFTPDEVALAVQAGAQPLDLGKTVLKVDTAALAVLAYARFMVGDV